MRSRRQRRQSGQAFVPMIVLAVFVVAVVGVFAFEIARSAMMRDQLRSATEAAALGGAAALAGSPNLDATSSQTNAMTAAKGIFTRNEIFGTPLTQVETDYNNDPKPGHAKLQMTYLNPKNNNQPVPIGDPNAKILLVQAKYGFTPVFASFIGLQKNAFTLQAQSDGGVGDLDVVMCFDISGSMDDQTLVTRVNRRWDPNQGKIVYDTVYQGKLGPTHGATLPQQLDYVSGFNPQLRGNPNTGSAPGNFPPGVAAPTGFTDAVINLDEQTSFGGITADGYSFPTAAVMVEAARGNLENATVFHASQADTALSGIVTPKAGYQAKYFETAHKHIHPIYDAQQAAEQFFDLMNKNSNAHFGLVAFDNDFGSTASQTFPAPNYAASYTPGGNGNFPIPGIQLQLPESQTGFTQVAGAVDSLIAYGGTNIGGAANVAVDMFNTNSRPNAKKVVIVFTDGVPTEGGPLSFDPLQNCELAAFKAKSKGIPIYSVAMALDPSLIPTQQRVLSDTSSTGMSHIAGNGGKFYQVTSASNLGMAFANIARQLTQLTD